MKDIKEKIIIALIILVVLIGVVVIIFISKNNKANSTTHNDIVYTINKVERISENEYSVPSEGNEFLLFNITIENNSKEEYQYSALDWQLIKKKDKFHVYGIDPENNLDGGVLSPNEIVTGSFAFEIPIGSNNFKLIYSSISNPENKSFEFKITG